MMNSPIDSSVFPVRILLVDDHEVLRAGLRALLEHEADLKVVGEAGTGAQAIALADTLGPDVMVLDLGLPDISGLEVIRAIRRDNTTVRIVVLSMHSRREYVVPAIEAGCDGYVPKSATHTSLLQAIRSVLAGEGYLHPTAAKALMGSIQDDRSETAQFEALSEREQDVIRLTVQGFTSREIGEKLDIGSKTVETYRQRATEKLQIEHRSGLIKFAVRAGLLDDFKSVGD
ncbi:MAG: response regulator transcription factor [Caldilineaceae bacterium]|nr:response regulator transcription factor [Caldilineaceae bacterium]MBP8110002.1 response regulator transcription factor [Caldilineaceae bacterium]MBP8125163.1 response regulator transcription factor [Caldilineaceae bacterium]MBP9074679.1 response regulator transcription factor [Caldilineaceae bacterium]